MFRGLALAFMLMAAAPSSTNYTLNNYSLGQGAGTGTSTNFTGSGQVGGLHTNGLSSTNFGLPAGIKVSETVAEPPAPSLTDAGSAYDRLLLVLNDTGFASDTKFLIAISTDNFTTTKYVQTDDTIGATGAIAQYQTYALWGGASGFSILGLLPGTTYYVKVAALQGSGTGSKFGPTVSVATAQPSLTFGLSTSLTGSPPFTVTFTSLAPGAPVSGNATANVGITTNALNGGAIYVASLNAGLKSGSRTFTITSATANLAVAAKGYGAQVTSATQSSGGPLTASSPFNVSGNNVGVLTTAPQILANFSAPITSGALTTSLIARSDFTVPAASDYSDTLTITAAPLF